MRQSTAAPARAAGRALDCVSGERHGPQPDTPADRPRCYACAMNPWLLTTIAFVAGFAGGAVLVLTMTRRGRDEAAARRLRREYDGYRQEVATHFAETAELVNTLSGNYRAVYDHLEQGAARLVGQEASFAILTDTDPQAAALESHLQPSEDQASKD